MNISNKLSNVISNIAKAFNPRTVNSPEPVKEEKKQVLISTVVGQVSTGNQAFDEQFRHLLRCRQH